MADKRDWAKIDTGWHMNRAALACWILILAALTFFATISPAALAAGVAVTVAARTAGHLSGIGDAGR